MFTVALLTAALAGPPVTFISLDGSEAAGELTAWSSAGIEVDGEAVDAAGVMRVRFHDDAAAVASEAAPVVTLRDGGLVVADGVTRSGRDVTVETAYGTLTLTADAVRAVRFQPAAAAVFGKWTDTRDTQTDSDLFVRLRGDVPDRVACVVGDVTAETVNIRARGRDLAVPKDKTFAVVFGGGSRASRPGAVVELRNGSRLTASAVELSGDAVAATVAGQSLTVPTADVLAVDLAAGRVVLLASVEPSRVRVDGFGPVYDEFAWKLREGRNAVGEPLRLGGKSYDSGYWMHSGTTAAFPLPAGAARFQAEVGIDELETAGSPVKLTVLADGRELFSETVRPEEPRALDLDVSGGRELTLRTETLKPDGFGIREHLVVIGGRLILD